VIIFFIYNFSTPLFPILVLSRGRKVRFIFKDPLLTFPLARERDNKKDKMRISAHKCITL